MTGTAEEQFIQIPMNLYEHIMFRDLEYVATKMLLYALRFTLGCNGAERKISNDETAIRSYFVTLQKKDFQVLGFPKQTITNKLQWFVQMNIFIEAQTALTLNHKPTNVYCYSLNLDFASWKDKATDSESKLPKTAKKLDVKKIYNKTVHTNVSLAPMQANKVKNALRCQKVLVELKEKSPIEHIFEILFKIKNNHAHLSEFFVVMLNTENKNNYLIGKGTYISNRLAYSIYQSYNEHYLILAMLTLDLQLILGTASLDNIEVENALIELIHSPEQALTDLFGHWINNIAQIDNPQKLRESFQDSLQELLALDGSLSHESDFTSIYDAPSYSNDIKKESQEESEQEDYNDIPD